MFSWVLHDKKQDRVIAARDPIGITTFYIGRSSETPGAVYFASELKCLYPLCDKIEAFPPGHVYDLKTDELTRYYSPKWLVEPKSIPTTPLDYKLLRTSFERSVRKRLMAEVGFVPAGDAWRWRGRRHQRDRPEARPGNAFAALADLKR